MNFLKTICFIYLFSTFFNNYGAKNTHFLMGQEVTKDPHEVLKVLKKIQKQEINSDYILINLYEFCRNPNLGSMYSSRIRKHMMLLKNMALYLNPDQNIV